MSLLRKHMGLTPHEARELKSVGFILKLVAIGCIDKDFYDVYVWGK